MQGVVNAEPSGPEQLRMARRAAEGSALHRRVQAKDAGGDTEGLFGAGVGRQAAAARESGADIFETGHCLRLYDGSRPMALPRTIRVRISSEAAGAIAFTPVVASEMALEELLGLAASAVGADAARVHHLLTHGSLVSGASRFRWERIECTLEEVSEAVRALPQPEPERRCAFERCTRVVLIGPHTRIEIEKRAGAARRLFQRSSFWDALMGGLGEPCYAGYSYRERADRYAVELDGGARERVVAAAGLLRYRALERQIRAGRIERVEWIVPR